MKFACLTTIAPGKTLAEQCATIAAAGCAGVETIVFPNTSLERWQQEIRTATDNAGLQTVAVILGGLALYQPDFPAWVSEALQAIKEVGAAALLTPEYRAQDPLPLFPPYPAPPAKEQAHVDAALDKISTVVTKLDMQLCLEPISQFESRFWRDVESVLTVCRRLNNPNVGLVLDFHNMNITEADINASIRRVGSWVYHIHLADNNRRLPGQGHIDFASGLATLRQIGYQGWYSFECVVQGDFAVELKQVIERLNQ
jgi:sugar phosphate isomerase/epimerase